MVFRKEFRLIKLRWVIAIVAVLVLCVLGLSFLFFAREIEWTARSASAREQIEIFEECREKAAKADAGEAVGFLIYAAHYYPSGTKQIAGSPLDWIVERERKQIVGLIIVDLKTKTGEDFGEDVERWAK